MKKKILIISVQIIIWIIFYIALDWKTGQLFQDQANFIENLWP